ncbi:MAG: alpha/beta hydrolase [Pseudomonadales bacterium]|nr:alpha/beta hydrolase [Pseudomonadales bacterium]
MLALLITLLVLAAGFWAIARFHLEGPDLSGFDVPRHPPVRPEVSAGHDAVLARVAALAGQTAGLKGRARLQHMRQVMDDLGADADLTGITLAPVDAGGVPAEWVTGTHVDASKRLLYIHGGAFTMGSPRSHRGITAELARRTGFAVLTIDYRLMPEHTRMDGIEDCRTAWAWLLKNGPQGPGGAARAFVAGDSAGGNLTLALIAWLRDAARDDQRRDGPLRQADGAIALSPLTDASFASPSITGNVARDPMLGPMAALFTRIPRPLLLWGTWLQNRRPPCDPLLSPVYGDLADLPPTLVQASEAEILIDDARRYVNKARAAHSPAELETWHGMVHVWQAFGADLPEADEAFTRMAGFVRRVAGKPGDPA